MYEALVAVDAPPNLIAWASSATNDHADGADLLRRNEDPTWAIWICAASGVPLRALVEAVALEAESAVRRLGESQPALLEVLEVTRGTLARRMDPSVALSAADKADALAANPVGSYRSLGSQLVVTPVASACAYLARASEALAVSELSLATQRVASARGYAALLGMGPSAFMPPSAGALCLNPATLADDPVQRQALFVPAAVAEAVVELGAAAERERGARDPKHDAAMNQRLSDLLSPLILS
ncbi:MAG: hypothetical protein R3B40_14295 [Polyangiales bacterium]